MAGQHRPDSRRETRHKGTTRSQKVETRATWVIERWAEAPSLRYGQMVDEVRERFECGIVAGQQAVARAYEMLSELRSSSYLEGLTDRISAEYLQNIEEAKRAKDRTEVRKTLDSLRKHLGLGAPERIELTDRPAKKMAELTDDELATLAKLDAAAAPEPEKVH